jgi:predicted DNA-binding transcriptional regulator AlpA
MDDIKEVGQESVEINAGDSIIRGKEVAKIIGVSISTVYKMLETQAEFPKPLALSERTVGWSKKEILDWIEYKKSQPRHVTLWSTRRPKAGLDD